MGQVAHKESVYTYGPTLVNVDDTGSYTGQVLKMRYNPAGTILVIMDTASADQNVRVFSSSSGILSAVAGQPGTQPSQAGTALAWNPAGTLCFMGGGSSGFNTSFNIHSVSGTTFTKLSNPATVPGSTNAIYGAAFNHDGTLLAVTTSSSPYIYLYSVSGTTLTYISSPATLPTAAVVSAAFSKDGAILAMSSQSSPTCSFYMVAGTTLTSITAPAGSTSSVFGIAFN